MQKEGIHFQITKTSFTSNQTEEVDLNSTLKFFNFQKGGTQPPTERQHKATLKGKAICSEFKRHRTPSKKRFHPYVDTNRNGYQSKKPSLSSSGLDGSSSPIDQVGLLCMELSGFGQPRAVRSLAGLMISNKPKLVFLMETKLHGNEWVHIKNKIKLPQALLVDGIGRGGGLVLLWTRDLEVEILSYSNIEASIKEMGAAPWRLVGFYDHHKVVKRKMTWNLLRFISISSVLPTIVIGDFNEVFFNYEHISQTRSRSFWQMNNFRQVAEDCGIFDVGCNNFTSPHSIRTRLNRGLASNDWSDKFSDGRLLHLSSNIWNLSSN
ncbi:hypothetical protein LIER_17723 [Lithospermum erythrorhizon]|uniref:Endonuclease/exonuclease/phosphatase domain-containing protein n=1 Tax=Lithospermum erythrorhizon TaxID=34254 RepID=A0AAV3QBL1_LITER